MAFNRDRAGSGYVLLNNTIRNHRARGMLLKARNGVVKGNRIDNSTLGGIVLTPELSWGEGDYSGNVSVIDNNITAVCIGKQCYGGIAVGAVAPGHVLAGGPPYGHANITIARNWLKNISQMNIWASTVDGLVIEDNVVEHAYAYSSVATCCPPLPFMNGYVAWVDNSRNASVSGNCIKQPPIVKNITLFGVTSSVVDAHILKGGFYLC